PGGLSAAGRNRELSLSHRTGWLPVMSLVRALSRRRAFHSRRGLNTFRPMLRLLTLAFTAVFSLALLSCGKSSPHVSGVEWKGEPLRVIARSDNPGIDALQAVGLEALQRHPPQRILAIAPGEWGDSLRLLEFPGELQAY